MKVTGEAVLHAPVERVWQALRDPAVLVRTIPGCERLEAAGAAGAYRITVTAGVASTSGTYEGTVRARERRPPWSFAISASAAGAPGTIAGDVQVRLSEVDGGTLLRYDADTRVGGLIGGVGRRLLTSVARRTAGEFLAALDDVLSGSASAVDAAGPPARRRLPLGVLAGAAIGFTLSAVWGRRRC